MEYSNKTTTKQAVDQEYTLSIPYTIILLSIAVLIIVVNSKVICLYCWKKKHILTIVHNRILLSLSICDLLTGVAVMVSAICHYRQTQDYTYRILCDMFTTFLVKTSIMHLCGVTIDRYLSLFFALRYRALVTRKAVHLFISISWALPLTVSVVALAWLHQVILHSSLDDTQIQNAEIWYSVVTFVVFVAVPMIILGAAFVHMFIEIRRLMQSTPRHHCSTPFSHCKRRLTYIFCTIWWL